MAQRLLLPPLFIVQCLLLSLLQRTHGRGDPHFISDEPHPDLNEYHYENMVFIGKHCNITGQRLSADHDHDTKFVFGSSFDDDHAELWETLHSRDQVGPDTRHDLPPGESHPKQKSRAQVLHERKLQNQTHVGPKPFGHVETHPLDGGVIPVVAVSVEPFYMDTTLVTNKQFAKFVRATYYETEAETFGWSYVLSSFVSNPETYDRDPDAPHWIAVPGAYWRQPEGPTSTYQHREHHPVVHVSHKDAATYCQYVNKRLPGEREWEAAARGNATKRNVYMWDGDNCSDWERAMPYANLWGPTEFPRVNHGADGWRGTSPVKYYPPNVNGCYDLTGNVWEWQRGGKPKHRIVRGGSFVDSLDGSFNHAATLGARSTLHGTTTTSNVGFRCAKSIPKRTEHHYQYDQDDELLRVSLVEGASGAVHSPPPNNNNKNNDPPPLEGRKKKKVVYKRERLSNEL